MRELPEPDIRSEEARDMGLEELPYFAVDTVLAIQKQAYEDGLNEVMKRILESQVRRMGSASDYDKGGLRAGQELEAQVRAMLTASQKEQK